MMSRTVSVIALMGALSLAALTPGLGQEGHEFMPKGGKTLLIELLGSPADAAQLREITQGKHSEEEWSDALAGQTSAMSEAERRTLAAYLAVNMPLPERAQEKAEAAGLAVTAVYHSHVGGAVYLSEMDLEYAESALFPFPDASHIVVSVLEGRVAGLGLFWRDGREGEFTGVGVKPEAT